ncbi:MAG TPA: VOC family protein, partial [Bacteroidia bacterium]|nr:VOC family protein [Bacteroidia bacterium]
EFSAIQRFAETPGTEKLSAAERQKIMHIGLPIGKGNFLMGTDAIESMGHKVTIGNNIQLSLSPESEEEATRLFNKLVVGGKSIVPMSKASWGDYFGMLTDKYGIQWMINYAQPKTKETPKQKEYISHL